MDDFEQVYEYPNAPHVVDRRIVLRAQWVPNQRAWQITRNGEHIGWATTATDARASVKAIGALVRVLAKATGQ